MMDSREHPPETVWQAQELYCAERLTYKAIAAQLGVADSTLRRWAVTHNWKKTREDMAHAEADIRVDKLLARQKMVKQLLDKADPQTAFAVVALERLALDAAKAARLQAADGKQQLAPQTEAAGESAGAQTPVLVFESEAMRLEAVERSLNGRIAELLSSPHLDLQAVKELKENLALLKSLKPADSGAATITFQWADA